MNLHNLIARDLSLIDVFYSIIINLNKSLLFLSPAHPLTRMEYLKRDSLRVLSKFSPPKA